MIEYTELEKIYYNERDHNANSNKKKSKIQKPNKWKPRTRTKVNVNITTTKTTTTATVTSTMATSSEATVVPSSSALMSEIEIMESLRQTFYQDLYECSNLMTTCAEKINVINIPDYLVLSVKSMKMSLKNILDASGTFYSDIFVFIIPYMYGKRISNILLEWKLLSTIH